MSDGLLPSGSSAAVAARESIERPAVERSRGRELLVRIATDRPLLLIVLIITLIALMTILEPTTFPRAPNAAVVLLDTAQTAILACGMMVLLISGMFDLSIGGILAFSGIMAGLAAKNLGLPPIVAFLIGCGWGLLLGAANGVLVTRFKINALIATLATLSIYRGLLQLVSGAGVTNIGNGFTVFGQTKILGIYSPFWFMAVIVLLFAFLVGRTRYFRQAYYIGGNARAAKLSGINVDRTVLTFFAIMGLLAGLAGALLASRLNTAVVLAGQGVELKVITAVVLGGASLSGGVGTIPGAFLGVLLMALLQNAMIIAGINPFWQLIVVGIVLLISVGLDQFARARLTMAPARSFEGAAPKIATVAPSEGAGEGTRRKR
jgi:ribose transport system permease protein